MTIRISARAALLLLTIPLAAQMRTSLVQPGPTAHEKNMNRAAEDISGMYSFLSDGEFLQIDLEPDKVSGYISRRGDLESDRGVFLDQFFEKASVQDHDVSFTTRPLHGVWFEFQGSYIRGAAKSRHQDGYFIIHGILKELVTGADRKTTSQYRDVEFKLLAQPADDAEQPTAKNAKKH